MSACIFYPDSEHYRVILDNGRDIHLSPREYDMLRAAMLDPERVFVDQNPYAFDWQALPSIYRTPSESDDYSPTSSPKSVSDVADMNGRYPLDGFRGAQGNCDPSWGIDPPVDANRYNDLSQENPAASWGMQTGIDNMDEAYSSEFQDTNTALLSLAAEVIRSHLSTQDGAPCNDLEQPEGKADVMLQNSPPFSEVDRSLPSPPSTINPFSRRIRINLRDRPVKYLQVEPRIPGADTYFTFNLQNFQRGSNSMSPLPKPPPHRLRDGPFDFDFKLPGDRYPRVWVNTEEVFPWTRFKDWLRGIMFFTFINEGGYCKCDDGRRFRVFWSRFAVALDDATYDYQDPDTEPFQKPSVILNHLGRQNHSHLSILPELVALHKAGFSLRRPFPSQSVIAQR